MYCVYISMDTYMDTRVYLYMQSLKALRMLTPGYFTRYRPRCVKVYEYTYTYIDIYIYIYICIYIHVQSVKVYSKLTPEHLSQCIKAYECTYMYASIKIYILCTYGYMYTNI